MSHETFRASRCADHDPSIRTTGALLLFLAGAPLFLSACKGKSSKSPANATQGTEDAKVEAVPELLSCDCAALLPLEQRERWPKAIKSQPPRPAMCTYSGGDKTSLVVTVKAPGSEEGLTAETQAALVTSVRVIEQKDMALGNGGTGVQMWFERENGETREQVRVAALHLKDTAGGHIVRATEVLANAPETLNLTADPGYLSTITKNAGSACQ